MKSLSQRTEGRNAHEFRPSRTFWPTLLLLASLVYVNHDYPIDHLLNILYWRLIPLIGKERALFYWNIVNIFGGAIIDLLIVYWGLKFFNFSLEDIGFKKLSFKGAAQVAIAPVLLRISSYIYFALWQSPRILRHGHWPTIQASWLPVNFSDPIFWCNHILYWGVGAFIEEIVDHGLLYTALRSQLKAPAAILIISLFFTLDHFHYDYHPGPFPSRLIVTLAVGIILAWMREWSGNIWCPLSAHWFNDFSSIWRMWTWTY